MGLGGISIWQLLIILVIVLLLFGTKRLRNLGGDLGNAVKGFKKAMGDEEKKAENEPERLEKAAEAIGDPTRVMAGTDCGFDTLAGIGLVIADVVWAKQRGMGEEGERGGKRRCHRARRSATWSSRFVSIWGTAASAFWPMRSRASRRAVVFLTMTWGSVR